MQHMINRISQGESKTNRRIKMKIEENNKNNTK